MSLRNTIALKVGQIWEGRGLMVCVLRVGVCIIVVERLDLRYYRIHPWQKCYKPPRQHLGDFDGMVLLSTRAARSSVRQPVAIEAGAESSNGRTPTC